MIEILLKKALHGAQGNFTLDVDIHLQAGEMVALYGPSGAGKSTLLRCLAGLERADAGLILVDGRPWFDSQRKLHLPPQQRQAGLMFQEYALFPNMSVRGNIHFALAKGARATRVDELLELMGLQGLQHSLPARLSGGQKQRLALARTLAAEPQLLLLDEPLSALDASTRSHLQDELKHLQYQLGLTTLLVSHDVGEVYKLAQRVLVLETGHITRSGTPVDVFARGETSGKFRFTGEVLAITPVDILVTLTVLVSQQIVQVAVMPAEAADLAVGDRVLLVAKAFNPMVMKLTS